MRLVQHKGHWEPVNKKTLFVKCLWNYLCLINDFKVIFVHCFFPEDFVAWSVWTPRRAVQAKDLGNPIVRIRGDVPSWSFDKLQWKAKRVIYVLSLVWVYLYCCSVKFLSIFDPDTNTKQIETKVSHFFMMLTIRLVNMCNIYYLVYIISTTSFFLSHSRIFRLWLSCNIATGVSEYTNVTLHCLVDRQNRF